MGEKRHAMWEEDLGVSQDERRLGIELMRETML